MVRALGYSDTPFDLMSPGRLCRGRERWIERWEPDAETEPVRRIVVSGAEFTDDSAADARRGITHSGVEVAAIVSALFPRKTLLAFMEDGHPADISPEAVGIEAYDGHRAGGRTELGLVRWHMRVSGVAGIRALLQGETPEERVRGFVVIEPGADDDALMERIFPLVGFSTMDSPPARYQPGALHELLEVVKAVILLHRDKHGPAIGVYMRGEVPKLSERLAKLCTPKESLLVPFAIPPMLARWDRALSELRAEWMQTRDEDFPVPPAPEPGPDDRRRGRRGRRGREPATPEPAEEPPAEDIAAEDPPAPAAVSAPDAVEE